MTGLADICTFMPIDRRVAYSRRVTLPDRARGAALFADVSGFTRLTGALMEELGPKQGAEEVLHTLNPVFDALISQLHHYGGAVIGFAGDSITCWLAGDDGRRAIACALAMQTAMGVYAQMVTEGGTPFSLHIKTAIAAGPARRFVVGDPQIRTVDVLAGETTQRMAAVEKLAAKGETLVEERVLAKLGNLVSVKEWREGDNQLRAGLVDRLNKTVRPQPWPKLPEDALSEDQVRPWLLSPVYDRLQTGQDYLAELRPAAALFLRFSGLDYDNDDNAGLKLDAYIKWVQRMVQRYHGYLIQLTVGDKGSFLYVAFGAPIARGDNTSLAAAAALELRAGSPGFDGIEQVRIGLSAGRMWTGAYGGKNRRTYGVMGNETNMAARLMGLADQGQILATGYIVEKAQAQFDFDDLGPVQVKGRDKPIRIWELSRMSAYDKGDPSFGSTPLVGREDVFSVITEKLRLAGEGEGQIIRLVGDPGMGKSQLTSHICRQAIASSMRIFSGMSQPVTRESIYFPWQQIFRSLLEISSDFEREANVRLNTFIERYNPEWSLRSPLIGDLLALQVPENPTTAALDGATRRASLFSLVVEIISALCQEQPLLLVFENGQWMDEASAELLELLSRQASARLALAILLVQRPPSTGKPELLPGLNDLVNHERFDLRGLDQADLGELIKRKVGGQPAPLSVSLIRAMTQGNPFFVNELLEAMQSSGQMVRELDGVWRPSEALLATLQAAGVVDWRDGDWQLKEDVNLSEVQLGLPDSVHALILSRLDRLPEAHKLTLKVGSVIGNHFDVEMVAKIHPEQKDAGQIQSEIDFLERERIIHPAELSHGRYAFRHHITREVTYETLLFTQRRQLHRAVAEALHQHRAQPEEAIAHHAYLGRLWPLALQANLSAGERALNLFANQQGIRYFRRALESSTALPADRADQETKRIRLALGELLVSTGQYDEAADHLQAAIEMAMEDADPVTRARSCRLFGRSYELRGQYDQAITWLDQGLEALKGFDSGEEAEISLIAGLIYLRQGAYDRTWSSCERSLAIADRLDDAAVRARTYNLMGYVHLRRGEIASLDRFRQSLAEYEKLENVYGQATSHNMLGFSLRCHGKWDLSGEHYRKSLALFSQMGDLYNQVGVLNNLGELARKQGRLPVALDYYGRSFSLLEQTGGSSWLFGLLRMNIANALIRLNETGKAQIELEQARDLFERLEVKDLLPELHSLLAETAYQKGDLAAAEEIASQSVELARELKLKKEEGHNLRILGEITQANNRFGRAKEMLANSLTLLSEVDDIYERAQARLALAHLQAVMGETDLARQGIETCEETFTGLGAQLDLARVSEIKSLLASGDGEIKDDSLCEG